MSKIYKSNNPMEAKSSQIILLIIFSFFIIVTSTKSQSSTPRSQPFKGRWKLLKKSIGISAMHIALLPNDRIIAFDRTDFGPSNITLPNQKCKKLNLNQPLQDDCYAHSIEFNPNNRNVRPLTVLTDTWCSSGSLASDGVLVQSGGFNDGERVVRFFQPCLDCDWMEDEEGLVVPRWYASNQILPNGKIIVVGGRGQFSYEFIPKSSSKLDYKVFDLPFLKETSDIVENNLYPFLHLSPDGNLFIFANTRSILLDYENTRVLREYPVMPGEVSRNYPSTGSSVLLPLNLGLVNTSTGLPDAEVFICGGSRPDSFLFANNGTFLPASSSCGRMIITSEDPKWVMEEMPINRVMGDMILLPNGEVLIINGAKNGTAGWYIARDPVFNPVLYKPDLQIIENSSRFEVLNPSKIARMYHSTAQLMSDGRVLVGGSNPNSNYNFTELYPTELSLEAFYPPYFSSRIARPQINWVKPGTEITYKNRFQIGFKLKKSVELEKIHVTMVAPSFTTHSFSMNQRLMVLDSGKPCQISGRNYVIGVNAPATSFVAPPGYYLLFVVHSGVPSKGKWVHIS